MKKFKEYINEAEEEHTSEWMSSSELGKHIPKTAHKQIHKSKEHGILMNHDLAHGGSGHLRYRVKTKSYDGFKVKKVQVASSKKDKDGFTHHATFGLAAKSAYPHDHMKTHPERKVTVPWHMKDDEIKKTTGR
jgi:hypothetical protein